MRRQQDVDKEVDEEGVEKQRLRLLARDEKMKATLMMTMMTMMIRMKMMHQDIWWCYSCQSHVWCWRLLSRSDRHLASRTILSVFVGDHMAAASIGLC